MTTLAGANSRATVRSRIGRGRFETWFPMARASAQPGEFAQPFHFGAGRQGAILLHHLAHLHVLLDDLIHFLHAGAAALGDALAPLAIDDVVVAALLVGHGIDDGLDLL